MGMQIEWAIQEVLYINLADKPEVKIDIEKTLYKWRKIRMNI